MFPAILYYVTEGITLEEISNSMTPGILRGYNRHAIRDRDYPALSVSSDGRPEVRGFVCFGLRAQSELIQKFHGSVYDVRRERVQIRMDRDYIFFVYADVYVWNGNPSALISPKEKDWSPSAFMKSDMYEGIMSRLADKG